MSGRLRSLLYRFAARIRRDALERDLDEELQIHRDLLEEEMRQEGVEGDTAQRLAAVRLGKAVAIRERARDLWSWGWIDALAHDLRYAARYLSRSPGFTLVALLSIALGVGANAATFTLVDRLFFRTPVGVSEPQDLRRLYLHINSPGSPPYVAGVLPWEMYFALDTLPMLGKVAGYQYPSAVKLGPTWDAPTLRRSLATWRYFDVLEVRPALGRVFVQGDETDGAPLVTVLSHRYWQAQYAGDSGVIGTLISMSGVTAEVVGVAAEGFTGLDLDPVDAWVPAAPAYTLSLGSSSWRRGRNTMSVSTIIRPPRPISDQAIADLISRTLSALPVDANWRNVAYRAEMGPIVRARGPAWHDAGVDVTVRLAGAAILILLAACANLGGLLLARGLTRERELAVRLAMGVSRRRLLAQLLTESALLCLLGTAAAIGVAQLGGRLLRTLVLPDTDWTGSPVDMRVIGVTLLVALAVGVLGTLLPAWRASRTDPGSALKTGVRSTGHGNRLRGAMISLQLGFSLVLLVSAGLFLRSLREALTFDVGFDAASTVTVSMRFIGGDPDDVEYGARLQEAAVRVRAVPGVREIARTDAVPYSSIYFERLAVPGRDISTVLRGRSVILFPVTPAAMRTYGIHALQGRILQEGDVPGAPPVVVVSQRLARLIWPGEDAIGKLLRVGDDSMPWREVVGVTRDLATVGLAEEDALVFVTPEAVGQSARSLVLHVEGNADAIAARVRATLASWRSDLASLQVTALKSELADQMRPWRAGGTILLVFGGIALTIAAIGVFGLVSFAVTRRRGEFGIRSALGATQASIAVLVLRDTAAYVAIGLLIGVAVSIGAARWLQQLLFHVSARDLLSICVASATLLAATLMALLHPLWRATRADPVGALRAE